MTKKRSAASAADPVEEILQFSAPKVARPKVPGAFGKEAELEKLRPLDRTGVIYIGHIPHGFYEEPMEKYFSQFGEVKNVVLCRSKKTGKSKGYAFVQFANDKVARIAAEATNGYALLEKVLKSHIVPAEKVSDDLFQYAGKKWNTVPWRKVVRDAQAEPKTEEEAQKRLARLTKREAQQAAKRQKLGIDFELGDSFEVQAKKRYGFSEEDNDEEEEGEEEEEEEEERKEEKVFDGKKGKSEDVKVEKLDASAPIGLKRKRDEVAVSSVVPAKKTAIAPSLAPLSKSTVAPSSAAPAKKSAAPSGSAALATSIKSKKESNVKESNVTAAPSLVAPPAKSATSTTSVPSKSVPKASSSLSVKPTTKTVLDSRKK